MAGRPRIFDEEASLKKATHLFWKKGYEATSTEDLMKEMGMLRGSFYNMFNSKKELFVKAINSHEECQLEELRKEFANSKQPIQSIKEMFFSLADAKIDEHIKGCLLGNIITELSNVDEELVNVAKRHLTVFENIFYEQIKKSQETGELKSQEDPKVLASYLLNLWNGINITRRIHTDKKTLRQLIEFRLSFLN